MTALVDILLIVSIILIAYFGWSAGFTRSFFAVLAGFVAIFAASRYPYQDGINFYLVFAITTLIIFLGAAFILRVINFFYMNIVDKFCGAILSAAIWAIVAINIIVPTLTQGTDALSNKTNTLYKTASNTMHKKIPIFKDYVPDVFDKVVIVKK